MRRLPSLTRTCFWAFLAAICLSSFFLEGTPSSASRGRSLSKVPGFRQQAVSEKDQADGKASLGARTVIPAPVWIIGSYDKEGRPNITTSSWVGVRGSKPACVMTRLRAATYTFGNIMARKAFTVNIPSESFVAVAAAVGRVSGRDVDKFKKTGLTPVKGPLVDAPYIMEFPMVIECRLKQTVELGSHTMFIGEIRDIKADRSILDEEGAPDIEKLRPFVYTPVSAAFFGIGKSLGRVSDLAKGIERP